MDFFSGGEKRWISGMDFFSEGKRGSFLEKRSVLVMDFFSEGKRGQFWSWIFFLREKEVSFGHGFFSEGKRGQFVNGRHIHDGFPWM